MGEGSDSRLEVDPELGLSESGEASLGERLRSVRPAVGPNWLIQASHVSRLGERVRMPSGDVEVVRRVGGGAMGTVYEASHSGSVVALKALNRLSPNQLYCLKKEFRTLSELSHPNVVSAYQLFGVDDTWYFTMEFVRGAALNHYWHEQARAHEGTAESGTRYLPALDRLLRELLRQLIEGVVATHRAGLVHRDLKPANVLVEPDGRLVIVDFGLVSDQNAGGIGQTLERAIAGTPAYMSPEQARGLAASTASDWYAVGVVLYELLTGHLPHEGSTSEVLHAKQEGAAKHPASLVPAIPPDLDDLCFALMHLEPGNRPTTDQMLALCRSWQLPKPSKTREHHNVDKFERFVGRREALGQLDRAYHDARRAGPTIVLVEGDSGIGKTALLNHFVSNLQRTENALLLQGRCYEQETVPHKAFDGIIDQLTRVLLRLPPEQALQLAPRHVHALTRLFPVLLRVPCFREAAETARPPADSAQLRRHGYEAMRELLCRIADRRSLVILIDDLHWGDDDSLRLVSDVLSPPDAARLLLVATYRRALSGRIEQILDRPQYFDTRHVQLVRLPEAEARSLAAAILDSEMEHTSAVSQAIAEEAEGMPLYVVELARSFREAGTERASSVEELLRRNIERLPSEPRNAFDLIAAAGRPLSRSLLARASELGDLHEPLALLRKTRLVRATVDDGGNEFLESYHHRVRQACLSLMTTSGLRHCRAKLTSALEESGLDEEEWISELCFAIGEHAAAARHAVKAAHQANNALAFHRAAELFEKAVQYFGGAARAETVAELHQLRARALANAGRSAEAAKAFSAAAKLSQSRDALLLASAANRQWMRSGHLEEATAGLRDIFRKLDILWPENRGEALTRLRVNRAKMRVLGMRFEIKDRSQVSPLLLDQLDALHPAQTALGMFDYLRGAYFASVALPLALRAGDPKYLVTALMSESVYSVMLGGTRGRAQADRVRQQLESVARIVSDPLARAIVNLSGAMCAYWEGRWQMVEALANAAAEGFTTDVLDGSWEAALARSVRNSVFVHTGCLPDARADLVAAVRDASARNDQYELLDVKRSLATIHLMNDDTERAGQTLEELEQILARFPFSAVHVMMTSSTVAFELYQGRPERAAARLEAGRRRSEEMGFLRMPLVNLMLLGMRADCIAADPASTPQQKAALLNDLAKKAAAVPISWSPALAHGLRAQAASFQGNSTQALAESERATRAFEAHNMGISAAGERLRCADLTLRRESESAREAALAILVARGIKRPLRWKTMIRSLY